MGTPIDIGGGGGYVKILGARGVTRSKFHTLGPPYKIQSPGRPGVSLNTQNKAEIFVNDAKCMYVTRNENHQQSRMLYNCM